MVWIPPGPFCYGLDAHMDTLAYGYHIGKYEVTNEQFYHFLLGAMAEDKFQRNGEQLLWHYAGDALIPAGLYHIKNWDDRIYFDKDSLVLNPRFRNHPVVNVTWFGGVAFCDYYGFELPDTKEWEKAARGPYNYWYPWGNTIDGSFANYYRSNDPFEPNTTPVGYYDGTNHNGFQTSHAGSVYGCYDMSGNAWEWTREFWSSQTPYTKGKGGGYYYHTPAFLQIYYTSTYGPSTPPPLDMCNISDGFRVVYKFKAP